MIFILFDKKKFCIFYEMMFSRNGIIGLVLHNATGKISSQMKIVITLV